MNEHTNTEFSEKTQAPGLFPLRDHQAKALDMLRQSVRAGKKSPIIQAPTGSGKTVLAAHVTHGAKGKGNRVYFIVPSLGLIDQTFERFLQNGIDPGDMGVIQADHPWRRPDAPIQICTVQTLRARKHGLGDSIAIVDEAHISDRWLWSELRGESRPKLTIGLSATPWSKGLGKIYDDLLIPTTTKELIEKGFLSKFKVFAPSHPDLEGVKTLAGDYHEGQLAERMSDAKLIGDVVGTWLDKGRGSPTLVFCVNCAHAKLIHDQFERQHVASAYVDAFTSREERERIGRQLASGEIEVVCNIGCLTTGIDWDIRCISLARPTKSEILFCQIIGRGLRPADGKDHLLILDHSDTHSTLGMVDQINHARLSDGNEPKGAASSKKKRDPALLPKECKACGCLIPAPDRVCPNCGAEIRPPAHVDVYAGELVEFDGVGQKPKGGPGTLAARVRQLPKQSVYGQLIGYARERGMKDGWAFYAFMEIFGGKPRRMAKRMEPPGDLVRSWALNRARRRAFAMRSHGERHV